MIGTKERALKIFIVGWELTLFELKKKLKGRVEISAKEMRDILSSLNDMAEEIKNTVFNLKTGTWIL